jgi:hypothetical protein
MNESMRATLRFLRFPLGEKRLLLALPALLAVARLGIRSGSVPSIRRAVQRLAPKSAIVPERLAELINVAAQRLPGFTPCLPRAIVLEALLRSSGRAAELRVGVATLRAGLPPEAHAWVELDGVAVAETVTGYTVLPLFGTRS